MNSSFIFYLIVFLVLFLMFIEIDNFKGFFFMFLIFLLLIKLSFNYVSWEMNFLSYDLWKLPLICILIFSFLFLFNLVKDFSFEVMFLYLMVFLGSMMVVISDNFMIIYLGMEMQTFSLFMLIAKNKFSIKGAESALKYFMLGSISSGFFLLGVTFLFSQGLSISVKDLYLLYNNSDFLMIVSLFLISISLFFKLALFPFHFWMPDMYEGSSLEVLGMISILPKISILSVMLQILNNSNFFMISSIFSMIMGTLGAMNQTKIKRFLAYSGMSHMGFMTLGIILLSKSSYEYSFAYLLIYIISMMGVFFLMYKSNFTKNYFIMELSGLTFTNKMMGLTWLILMLSMGGMPPLSGFIAKLLMLNILIDYNYLFIVGLVLLFSALSIGYYLSMVKMVYFQKFSSYLNWENVLKMKNKKSGILMNYLLGIMTYFNLVMIVRPSMILTPLYLSFNYFF